MKFSVEEYSHIIKHCYTLDEVNKAREFFMEEDYELYSTFEKQVIKTMLTKRENLIKSIQ